MTILNIAPNNVDEVWNTLFGHRYVELPIPEYKVRISKYEDNFTEELYEVDQDNEPIIGEFYKEGVISC